MRHLALCSLFCVLPLFIGCTDSQDQPLNATVSSDNKSPEIVVPEVSEHKGRTVIGKLVPEEGFTMPSDLSYSVFEYRDLAIERDIRELQGRLRIPMAVFATADGDPEKQRELIEEWKNTSEEGRAYAQTEQEWLEKRRMSFERRVKFDVSEDGTFRIDGVPKGEWELYVELRESLPPVPLPGGGLQPMVKIVGWLFNYPFTVDAIPNDLSGEPLDLGILTVDMLRESRERRPLLEVGQVAPDFEIPQIFPITEDARLRLSDYKGRIIILDFWATWCPPCLAKMPEMQKIHELIKDDPRFVMIGISVDSNDSAERLGEFVVERKLLWVHGLAGNSPDIPGIKDYGVSVLPTLFLIDGDGRILLSKPSVGELSRKISDMTQ